MQVAEQHQDARRQAPAVGRTDRPATAVSKVSLQLGFSRPAASVSAYVFARSRRGEMPDDSAGGQSIGSLR